MCGREALAHTSRCSLTVARCAAPGPAPISLTWGFSCGLGDRGHDVVQGDSVRLPYRSGGFDAAISIAVLHHLSSYGSNL
jgi:hypothetical protein